MRILAALLLLMVLSVLGCSGGHLAAPLSPDPAACIGSSAESSHALWGLWQGVINPDTETIEFTKQRYAEMHINVVPFLEPPALVNLTLDSLEFNGNIIEADIGLRHPFLGLTEFTGFDVTGIFITSGSVSGFDDANIVMAGDGDTRLLNPDGYSRWWNPAEFPINEGTIFSYNDGLLGAPDSVADYSSTVNAYKYYCDDLNAEDTLDTVVLANRGMFTPGAKNIRHYTIEMGAGGLVFNYAIDACWNFPQGSSPWTVPDDFGPNANRFEAWRININEDANSLWNDGIDNGGDLELSVDIYDWFNPDMNTVRVESPGNFTMVESVTATGGGAGYSTYEIEISDAAPAEGSIDVLISVECENSGYGGLLPGEPVTAYFTYTADVNDEAPVFGEGGVITFGGSGTEYILGFTVDSEGGKYSGGYFFGECNLDPDGNDPHTAVGGGNMWLNKVAADGDFEWGYSWPSMPGYHSYIWEIEADDNDDIYVCGHFVGIIDFDPGTGVDDHTASGGSGPLDAFLMKFNSDGEYQWGASWGGSNNVTAFDVVLDGNGYVYIAGYFFNTADLDPTSGGVDTHIASSASGNVCDAYLLKLDTDGNFYWARSWGANATTYGFDVTVDGNGDPSASGTYQGSAYLQPGSGGPVYTSNGAGDTWLVKFAADGTFQWSLAFGGNSWDQINSITADSQGNIYATGGSSSSSVDYDPGTGDMTIAGLGSYDGFLSKFDTNGAFLWVKMFAEPGHDNTWGIDLDASGNILMCGHFNGTMDMDPGSGEDSHEAVGNADAYVVKLTSDGEHIWATSWGGTGYDNAQSVDAAYPGLIHIAGRFDSTVDFDPGPGVVEDTSNGGYDTFIQMLRPDTGGW